MNIYNYIALFFLNFSHVTVIVPSIIIGFLAFNRKIFGQILCILLLSIFTNALLKSIFQIPLLPHLNITGYAFPSGHMQSSMVFYGWLLINVKKTWFKYLLLLILSGIGFGLIEQGYHNIYDILGGVFFGIIILSIFHFILRRKLLKNKPSLVMLIVLPIMISIRFYFISINYKISSEFSSSDIWLLYIYGLLAFSFTWLVLNKYIFEYPSWIQAATSILCFVLILAFTYYICSFSSNKQSFYMMIITCITLPFSAFSGRKIAMLKLFRYNKLWRKLFIKALKINIA